MRSPFATEIVVSHRTVRLQIRRNLPGLTGNKARSANTLVANLSLRELYHDEKFENERGTLAAEVTSSSGTDASVSREYRCSRYTLLAILFSVCRWQQ